MTKNKEFEKYLTEIDVLYKIDPKKVNKITHQALIDMGYYKPKTIYGIEISLIIVALLFIFIALLGISFTNLEETNWIYYFGMIFFGAGIMTGLMPGDKNSILFFYTHGGVGLGIMSFILYFMGSPVGDISHKIMYFMIVGIFYISAIIYVTVIKLNDEIKTYNHQSIIIAVSLFLIGLFLLRIMPYIFTLV